MAMNAVPVCGQPLLGKGSGSVVKRTDVELLFLHSRDDQQSALCVWQPASSMRLKETNSPLAHTMSKAFSISLWHNPVCEEPQLAKGLKNPSPIILTSSCKLGAADERTAY
eukprot:TRINITY_DN249_c2_g1_i3.p3 TRINITY_DN249_c2_g1~~TRINITY_DN249_c2_g1_i3.p3  ORF type:complete len:111 (-),score=9.28 TRINITY_DN249_c2_g1_i3:9-341(-)